MTIRNISEVPYNFNPRTSCEVRRCTGYLYCLSSHDFNPRTSCEVRQLNDYIYLNYLTYFNPRTSCEVRLVAICAVDKLYRISIHAPRVRCDKKIRAISLHAEHFNPRTSCEVRLSPSAGLTTSAVISIHAPRVRCDLLRRRKRCFVFKHFNPRTSCEVRRPAVCYRRLGY